MDKELDSNETLAIILSHVKSIVSHLKIDKRRQGGDTAKDAETVPDAMLQGIAKAVNEIASRRTFNQEQVATIEKNAANVANFLFEGQKKNQAELTSLLEVISEKLEESLTAPQQSTDRHEFAVYFKNSKAAITMILLGIALLISGIMHIKQLDNNSLLRDNDIRYRYIQMQGKATPEDVLMLREVFDYNRDTDSINVIRQKVDKYERLIQEQAEKQARAKLNNEQAQQLQKEAESLKK